MAKTLETFESETIGTTPSSWTSIGSATWQVTDDGLSPTDLFVRYEATTATTANILHLTGSKNSQVLARVRSNFANSNVGIILRGDLRGGSLFDGYAVRIVGNSANLRVFELNNGVHSPALATVNTGETTQLNTWYWMRVSVLEGRIYAKKWEDGTTEPEQWQISVANDTFPGDSYPGVCGLISDSTGSGNYIDCSLFSLGTDGDPADLPEDEVGLRLTQAFVQSVDKLDSDLRTTTSAAMTLYGGTAEGVRATSSAVMALYGSLSEGLRTTRSAVLVLASGVPCITHWTQAWTITRTDGTVFRYTTLDVDLTWRGNTYKTCASLASTASENVVGLSESGNVEINAIINSNNFKDEELLAGWFDGATVEAWVVPWQTDEGEFPFRIFFGLLGQITKGTVSFKADVVTQASIAQQKNLLDIYMPSCRHVLGDSNCGVSLAGLQVSGAVTSITQPTTPGLSRKRVFLDSARTEDDGYFNFGVLTWTTGENAGQSNHVDMSVGSTITLWDACAYRIEIGDQYTMTPGCDKLSDTCKNKFSNFVNFGGFPHIPGKDELIGWRPKATEIR